MLKYLLGQKWKIIALREEGLCILPKHRKIKYPQVNKFSCLPCKKRKDPLNSLNNSWGNICLSYQDEDSSHYMQMKNQNTRICCLKMGKKLPFTIFFISLMDESCLPGKLLGGHQKSSPLQLFLFAIRTFVHSTWMCVQTPFRYV